MNTLAKGVKPATPLGTSRSACSHPFQAFCNGPAAFKLQHLAQRQALLLAVSAAPKRRYYDYDASDSVNLDSLDEAEGGKMSKYADLMNRAGAEGYPPATPGYPPPQQQQPQPQPAGRQGAYAQQQQLQQQQLQQQQPTADTAYMDPYQYNPNQYGNYNGNQYGSYTADQYGSYTADQYGSYNGNQYGSYNQSGYRNQGYNAGGGYGTGGYYNPPAAGSDAAAAAGGAWGAEYGTAVDPGAAGVAPAPAAAPPAGGVAGNGGAYGAGMFADVAFEEAWGMSDGADGAAGGAYYGRYEGGGGGYQRGYTNGGGGGGGYVNGGGGTYAWASGTGAAGAGVGALQSPDYDWTADPLYEDVLRGGTGGYYVGRDSSLGLGRRGARDSYKMAFDDEYSDEPTEVKPVVKVDSVVINGKTLQANAGITAKQVFLLGAGPERQPLGAMPTSRAQALADEAKEDLLLINPDASPPVARIVNWSKYKYELEKSAKERKAKSSNTETKEVRLRPSTDSGDIAVKLKSCSKFLAKGDRVKLVMKFEGRELQFKEQGKEVLLNFISELASVAKVEGPLNFKTGTYTIMLAPNKP